MTPNEATPYHEIAGLTLQGYYWDDDEPSPDDKISQHLKFIADIDLSEPDYSFDLFRIYVRPADGAVLYATDSGCSCPTPFENTKVSDLKETTLAGLDAAVERLFSEDRYGSGKPISEVLGNVHRYRPAMEAAGAK